MVVDPIFLFRRAKPDEKKVGFCRTNCSRRFLKTIRSLFETERGAIAADSERRPTLPQNSCGQICRVGAASQQENMEVVFGRKSAKRLKHVNTRDSLLKSATVEARGHQKRNAVGDDKVGMVINLS